MTLHDNFFAEIYVFFHFRSSEALAIFEAKKARFSEEKWSLAGGGIEPPTRGFSVLCSAN